MAKSVDVMEVDAGNDQVPRHSLDIEFDEAEAIMSNLPDKAIQKFQEILTYQEKDMHLETVHRVKEHAVYKLARLYVDNGRETDLGNLLKSLRPFFATIPKAKTGKIVRTVIDMVSKAKKAHANLLQLQEDLCTESIEWCNTEKHVFLRQRIEARLASILFEQGKFQQSLELITRLLREIKKMDDKQLLVELHLVDSRLHHALQNLPKAKAALTAARSIANSVYINPKMQASIDMMSGTIHAEERDYKTAYSYFYEAFEAFNQLNDEEEALPCLKYMLLSKVASGNAADVQALLNGKQGLKYAGIDLDAMRGISKAHEKRSLEAFESAVHEYSKQISEDSLIRRHLALLYDRLLEANLMKIIEPFSCVEIDHVAHLIKLPLQKVEVKLSQMILDHKLHGILDQGKGQLIVYHSPQGDKTYSTGLELVTSVDSVVESLFKRADLLSAS